jgi:hypothetical protein
MRFSATALLALPLLGVAAEGPFDQYKAQFQNFLSSFGAAPPQAEPEVADKPDTPPPAAAHAPSTGNEMTVLTLDNWRNTLAGPVQASATKPEEWWVLITGGNKSCFGTRHNHAILSKLNSSIVN